MLRPDALCRITLLEKIGNGKLAFPYGQESRIPMDGLPPSDEDFSDPSRCAALGTDPENRVMPRRAANFAVSVLYEVDYNQPNMRSIDMPVGCAKLHFGDWEIQPGAERTIWQMTVTQEKARVAAHWGDYKYPRALNKEDIDKRIIGAPAMPKVKIQVLDARMHTPLEPAIFPHEIWNFEADIDQEAVAEVKRRGLAAGAVGEARGPIDLSKLTIEDIAMLRRLLMQAPAEGEAAAIETPPVDETPTPPKKSGAKK